MMWAACQWRLGWNYYSGIKVNRTRSYRSQLMTHEINIWNNAENFSNFFKTTMFVRKQIMVLIPNFKQLLSINCEYPLSCVHICRMCHICDTANGYRLVFKRKSLNFHKVFQAFFNLLTFNASQRENIPIGWFVSEFK